MAYFVLAADTVLARPGIRTTYSELTKAIQGPGKSTVYDAVTLLEDFFGQDVFDLDRGRLTTAGGRVYAWAKNVLEAHRAWRHLPIGEREQLVIGATASVDTFILPQIVAEFVTGHRGEVDVRVRVASVETLLGELHLGFLHAVLCGVPSSGAVGDLLVEDIWTGIPTVMIASECASPPGNAKGEDWRDHRTWLRRREDVRLHELAGRIVCVLESDLKGVLANLPRPSLGGSRIIVERYASILSIVQAGEAVGFVPLLGRGDERSHYPGYKDLLFYRLAEAEGVATRRVCLWRTERPAVDDERQAKLLDRFLEVVRKYSRD